MILELLVSALLAFISVLAGGIFIIPILVRSGFIEQDINKLSRPMLPAGGGILLLFGIFIGVMSFVFASDFIIGSQINSYFLMASFVSVAVIAFIGFMDDLMGSRVRTSKASLKSISKNYIKFSGGLKQWQKPLLTLVAAIPVMTINFGSPVVSLPFIGSVTIPELLYTIVFIPLAIAFAANSFNMLEGLNGIAVEMSIVAFSALALFAYHTQQYSAFGIAMIFVTSLIAYLYYGAYPSKILPGDSLTYLLGAGFASVIIIGNMAPFGMILIIPWIVEFILKARIRFHAHSWGLIQKDGTLKSPHDKKIYSMTHLFLRTGKFKEWQIPLMLAGIEAIFAAAAIALMW